MGGYIIFYVKYDERNINKVSKIERRSEVGDGQRCNAFMKTDGSKQRTLVCG